MPQPDHRMSAQEALHHEAEEAGGSLPPLLLEADHLANTVMAGVHGRRRAGSGETFWQFRPFVEGDVSTQIDWRQSARSDDRLYIRQREWEVAATAWLWRDPGVSLDYAHADDLPTKRRRADVLATAVCTLLARAGERIGYAGASRRPFMGRRAAEQFAGEIVGHSFSPDRLPPIINAAGEKKYVIFSDFFLPPVELEPRLRAIAAQRATAHLVQIIDPSEEDYRFEGRMEFLAREQGLPKLLFGDAGAVAGEYRKLFQAHQGWLQDTCRHLGWSFMTHRTDHAPETALIALYRALAPEALV
ncbi:DUF58 domain-containing protein [Parvularcula sp. IMCC14364]|uniref:DUF58 domain-containing protein n=1 Tax=Parvularcula sp. IMCC14364 TaxID=3067902 RepID=UPI0027404889|nr:DUF58 domain-containing protein [Parvularcula sp. IMCC14364]